MLGNDTHHLATVGNPASKLTLRAYNSKKISTTGKSMRSVVFALGVLLTTTGAAYAQSEAALCHHAGLTYSPGALITMGKSLQKCSLGEGGVSQWAPSTNEDRALESSNCVSDDKQYGQGAIVNTDVVDLRCSNGTWYPL